jgi:hypothetical protein
MGGALSNKTSFRWMAVSLLTGSVLGSGRSVTLGPDDLASSKLFGSFPKDGLFG